MPMVSTDRRAARVDGRFTEAHGHRPIRVFLLFVLILAAAVVGDFHFLPFAAAVSAATAELLFLILFVAAWDLVAMAMGSTSYLAWLPQHPVPPWLQPVRSSFIVVAFAYGILLGHYFWQ
jgi:hypothetical protein